MARVFDASIITPQQIPPEQLQQYDLVDFGVGINSGKHYKPILDFAGKLPPAVNKKAFIFLTAGLTGEKSEKKITQNLEKNWNQNSFSRFFGGMNKSRPNADDLKNAEEFALNLKTEL